MTYTALKRRVVSSTSDADALIHAHLPLVRRLAWHVHGKVAASAELEELIQAGMVALVEAAHAFEDRGFAFATYASLRIKGAMIDHLRRGSGQSRGSSSSRRAIAAARRTLETSRAGAATASEIAAQLGVPVETYFEMEADTRTGAHEPLEDAYADDDMMFCDPAERHDAAVERAAGEAQLRNAILALDQRSQLVLQLYFFEEMNLHEIGQVLNIGAARVCQIKAAALKRLKNGGMLADFASD